MSSHFPWIKFRQLKLNFIPRKKSGKSEWRQETNYDHNCLGIWYMPSFNVVFLFPPPQSHRRTFCGYIKEEFSLVYCFHWKKCEIHVGGNHYFPSDTSVQSCAIKNINNRSKCCKLSFHSLSSKPFMFQKPNVSYLTLNILSFCGTALIRVEALRKVYNRDFISAHDRLQDNTVMLLQQTKKCLLLLCVIVFVLFYGPPLPPPQLYGGSN